MSHIAAIKWAQDSARLRDEYGIIFPDAVTYVEPDWRRDYTLAMDAQPTLVTTPNAGIPSMFTTMVDPRVIEILLAPNKAAEILGEEKKGSWVDQTAMFPVVERTGEVSSYGDFNANGRANANTDFPQRQSYLYQTVTEYGELELERAGRAAINWAAQLDIAAATVLTKFQNLTYFRGVQGLQNYGLQNDPALSASLTPGTKAAGNGNVWIFNGAINATANEVFADIQALYFELVSQTGGLVEQDAKLVLALSPGSAVALTATNSFNVNVSDLIKKNFPNLRVVTAVQYGALSSSNPQGIAAGNFVQLIAEELEGEDTGYCAFNEKMRAHPIIRAESSFRQKKTQGSWGAILRYPVAFAGMIGI
jgi:hypothetical protein